MTLQKNICIIITLLLFACKGKNEKQEADAASTPIIASTSELNTESEPNTASSKSAELFAQAVLKENNSVHEFDATNLEKVSYLEVFNNEGLDKIIAYANKNYPKNSEPNHYEHFTLFVASYQDEATAQNAYNQILEEATIGFSNLNEVSGALAERARILAVVAKAGGMITKKGTNIFSLVETCREPPMGNDWIDYENTFLEYMRDNEEDIQVLNANCGMDRFLIEKRKVN